jgi:uncharacterized protein
MRVVLDTNVLISAVLIKSGNPLRIVEMWEAGSIILVLSQETLAEVERVFTYPKIQNRLQSRKEEIGAFLDLLRSESLWVEIQEQLNLVAPDGSDNRYIETAVARKANYIVTEENHLLALGRYRGIEILTPAAFILNYSRVKARVEIDR